MAGMTDHPHSWADVDIARAVPSDPRPWEALVSALAERCAAVGRPLPVALHGVYLPSISACEAVRSEIALLCRNCFVTLDAPRASGLGWNYGSSTWNTFPRHVWPSGFYKPSDAIYPVEPPFPESGHPMLVPSLLAPEGDSDDIVYREFLSDCGFWLDACRYVFASHLAVREQDRGRSGLFDTLAGALAAAAPSSIPVRGTKNIEVRYRYDSSGGSWQIYAGPFRLVAVNPASMPAVARLVLCFRNSTTGGNESSVASYESREIDDIIPGPTFEDYMGRRYAESSTRLRRTEYRHGANWVAGIVQDYSASGVVPEIDGDGDVAGADRSNAASIETMTVRVWDESGTQSLVDEDRSWTRTESTGAHTDADASAEASYRIYDPINLGVAPGVADISVPVLAHSRAVLIDIADGFAVRLDPVSLIPASSGSRSLDVRFSCTPHVVLDYRSAYQFRLDQRS